MYLQVACKSGQNSPGLRSGVFQVGLDQEVRDREGSDDCQNGEEGSRVPPLREPNEAHKRYLTHQKS